MACAPESRQRLIHSGAQVGTTTIGVMLSQRQDKIERLSCNKVRIPYVQTRDSNIFHGLYAHCHVL